MRKTLLATAAAPLALMTTLVMPASAGSLFHHHHDDDCYHHHQHYYTYTYKAPLPVVYKHYLPDEDDFGPLPRRYVPWYVTRHYYHAPIYSYRSRHRHHSSYRHSSDGDCRWLKRRAKDSDSRYWWKRYEDCRD